MTGRTQRFGELAVQWYGQGHEAGATKALEHADRLVTEILVALMLDQGITEIVVPDKLRDGQGGYYLTSRYNMEQAGTVYTLGQEVQADSDEDEENAVEQTDD